MNDAAQTLIILSPGFPENEADTTCLPPKQVFVKSLNKNFPSLNILILSFQYPYTNIIYKWNGNTVIPFNGKKFSGKFKRVFLWIRIWKTRKLLKNENNIIGIYSFWLGECAFIGKWFAKFHQLKHYCWISGQDAKKNNGYVRLMKPKPNELVAMSDFLEEEFYRNYQIKPEHVIPIGIEPTMFSNTATEKDIDLIGAGSLIPLKQYDVFIDVVKNISIKLPSVKAMICGKGEEEKKLQSLINSLQLQKNILLAGEKSHPEILSLMQRSKILLHTSFYEGFGSVCIEALYAGAHVISFTKPMNAEIPHWHVVGNKESMVAKAIELLTDTELSYNSITPYLMDDTAKAVMKLFA